MKKPLLALAFLAVGYGGTAHASEYGCKVLLCLANPASNGGPKGVAECVPPIDQLYHDLSKGRPFPTCDMADGNDGSSYARPIYDPYDPCPDGTRPAAQGSFVVQGTKKTNGQPQNGFYGWYGSNFNVSGQPAMSQPPNDNGFFSGSRACVGNLVGQYMAGNRDESYTVQVYDRVVWQAPQNPRAIDVFIDNKFYQRVRY